jgi:uncharacterized protein (DUF362 family)/ferredoxin
MYLSVRRCESSAEIREAIRSELAVSELPRAKDASILIKPNLNSNMNALTGNTTDLRIVVGVVEYLKDAGFRNITIGEGTSSGFHREKINIFSRLMADKIAQRYDIGLLDFNYAPSVEVEFENGTKARIAKACVETDFFINIPKLKTHFETMMSVCLKNLIGCLTGVYEKQKAHRSLCKNILNLNKVIKPDLHIVDGIIAMEGTGPSSGTPRKMGQLVFTTDPFLGDLACARLADIPHTEVPCLRLAEEAGIIGRDHLAYLESFPLDDLKQALRRPKVNLLVRLVNNPKWQHYLVKVRLLPGISWLFSTKPIGKILNLTGLRQDVFIKDEIESKELNLMHEKCKPCGICTDYCPIGELDMPRDIGKLEKGCIHCFYCYLVCPERAIEHVGSLGFLTEQIRQYDKVTRREILGQRVRK